jgi:hypothetical protein
VNIGGDMHDPIVKNLDKMTDKINHAVANIKKKSPCEYSIQEFMARQAVIFEANAANRHRKCVLAGRKAVSTMLDIKARVRGLKYILTKPLKRKKRKKIISTNQLSLF